MPSNRRTMPRFRFDEFKPGQERWQNYETRLLYALQSQGFVTGLEQKEAFISNCSGEAFEAIANYLHPREISDATVTFMTILQAMRARFAVLDPSPAVAEQDFLDRRQKPGEPFSVWVEDLRRLASFCQFDNLNVRLKGQLIRGTADPEAKAKLLRKDSYSLEKVIEILQAYERARRGLTMNPPTTNPWASVHSARPVRGGEQLGPTRWQDSSVCTCTQHGCHGETGGSRTRRTRKTGEEPMGVSLHASFRPL